MASYQGLRDNGARGPSIVSASIACARTCNLDKDILDLPGDDVDCKTMTIDVRPDAAVARSRNGSALYAVTRLSITPPRIG